jgi:hypothetical protein
MQKVEKRRLKNLIYTFGGAEKAASAATEIGLGTVKKLGLEIR